MTSMDLSRIAHFDTDTTTKAVQAINLYISEGPNCLYKQVRFDIASSVLLTGNGLTVEQKSLLDRACFIFAKKRDIDQLPESQIYIKKALGLCSQSIDRSMLPIANEIDYDLDCYGAADEEFLSKIRNFLSKSSFSFFTTHLRLCLALYEEDIKTKNKLLKAASIKGKLYAKFSRNVNMLTNSANTRSMRSSARNVLRRLCNEDNYTPALVFLAEVHLKEMLGFDRNVELAYQYLTKAINSGNTLAQSMYNNEMAKGTFMFCQFRTLSYEDKIHELDADDSKVSLSKRRKITVDPSLMPDSEFNQMVQNFLKFEQKIS